MRTVCVSLALAWGPWITCTPPMRSADDVWEFKRADLVDQAVADPPYPIIVGSRLCPDVRAPSYKVQDDVGYRDLFDVCVDADGDGVVVADGGCFTVADDGVGAWLLPLREDCPYDAAIASDRLEVRGVPLSDVVSAPHNSLEASVGQPDAAGDVVPPWVEVHDTMRVFGGQFAEVRLRLQEADGTVVAWPLAIDQLVLDGGDVELAQGGRVLVRVPAGVESTLRVVLPAGEVSLIRVVGVGPEALASLQLVAPQTSFDARQLIDVDGLPPLTFVDRVWAVYRTHAGDAVWGVPTTWEFNGDRILKLNAGDEQGSSLIANDNCEPLAPGRHWWWVEATADVQGVDLVQSARLRYRYPRSTLRALEAEGAVDLNPDNFEPVDGCPERTCGCATTGPAGSWSLLVLFGLFALRRRR